MVPSRRGLKVREVMGYKVQRKLYVLQFEDKDGMEVKATSVSTGVFLKIASLADAAKMDISHMQELITSFAKESLRSWNLEEEDGTPIPATSEGLLSLEFEDAFEIITAWIDTITGVNADLKVPSSGGSPSLVASLPMEPLSDNPGN